MSVSPKMGDKRPQEEALDDARGLNSPGLNVKWFAELPKGGDSGNVSRPSETDEEGEFGSLFRFSIFFLTLPRFFSNLDVSMLAALRRAALPGLASGLMTHQLLLPVPSF